MHKKFVFIILLFSFNSALSKVNDTIPQYNRLGISYIIGGQLYNDNFLYNPGYELSFQHTLYSSNLLSLGFGTNFTCLQNEKFIPFYADLISYKKNKINSEFLLMQIGYAYAWNNEVNQFLNYEFYGGIFFNTGIGKKISITDKFSMLCSINYRHQLAYMKYMLPNAVNYRKTLNYDMIVISTSFQL